MQVITPQITKFGVPYEYGIHFREAYFGIVISMEHEYCEVHGCFHGTIHLIYTFSLN